MRVAVIAAVIFLSACASDKLERVPPPGVDFSGNWKLNLADSDDPLHVTQSANGAASGTGNSRSGRGGGGSTQGYGNPALAGPATPSFGAVGAGLRWPGKKLEIKQVGGVVTFVSDGRNRVCQAGDVQKKPRNHSDPSDKDADLPASRQAPPPKCGWSDKTLIIQSRDPDDRPPFEERYSLSEDGNRLIENVGFRNGYSNGFTMTRVWDRVSSAQASK
jgi:hypothetical protein